MVVIRRMKPKRNNRLLYFGSIIVVIIVVFLSVGFSAFLNQLFIDDISLNVRVDRDIRVSGVRVDSVNDATSYYEDYNVSNISGRLGLNSDSSYVIYEVDIYNLGNTLMGIREASIDNENLKFEFLDYNLKDKICENGQCSLGIKKKIRIKISYKEGVDISSVDNSFVLNFTFGRIFSVSYFNISESDSFPKEVIEGDSLNLHIPQALDYHIKVFMGDKLLSYGNDYEYSNDYFVLNNIMGDVRIYYKMPICQRATILHTEECKGNYCSGMGYKPSGSMGTSTITYGKLGNQGVLASGDAFDCDVNGDGVYDANIERFYYVTDLDNNSNVGIFIYYNNVSEGMPRNDLYYQYNTIAENWHGPLNAVKQLPTKKQWSNVSLFNSERKIVNEYGTTSTKDGHKFPDVFSYSEYAARFLTFGEVKKLVNFYIPTWKNGELDDHIYLVENTNFSKKDHSKFDVYWLETLRNTMSSHSWIIYATARRVHSVKVQRTDVLIGVRPVIEVSKSDIVY